MTRFVRMLALFCCLSTTAIAGTLSSATINLNGTPLNIAATPSQKTLAYVGGLAGDSFSMAYSYDGTNYIGVPNCTSKGANWSCPLTYPAQYIAAIGATGLSGSLSVISVFSNGVTSISPTNHAINLPASGGAGTSLDTTSLPGLTNIITVAYANGNPGSPYYPGSPTDQVVMEGSPDNTNWVSLQGVSTPCDIQGAKGIVQCYAGPRYLRARYVAGQGVWPAGCSGSCNTATMYLQMSETQLTANNGAASLIANSSSQVPVTNQYANSTAIQAANLIPISGGMGASLGIAGESGTSGSGSTLGGNGGLTYSAGGNGGDGTASATSGSGGGSFVSGGWGGANHGGGSGGSGGVSITDGNLGHLGVPQGNNGGTIAIFTSPGGAGTSSIPAGTPGPILISSGSGGTAAGSQPNEPGASIAFTAGNAGTGGTGTTQGGAFVVMTQTAQPGAGIQLEATRLTQNKSAPYTCAGSCTPTVAQLLDSGIIISSSASPTLTFPSAKGSTGIVQNLPWAGSAISGAVAIGDTFQVEFISSASTPTLTLAASSDGSTSVTATATLAGQTSRFVLCSVAAVTPGSETILCN